MPCFRHTLQTWVKALLRAFADGFINIDEKVASKNNRLECENHILFETKMAKTNALFLTKPAKEAIETIDTLGWKNLEI